MHILAIAIFSNLHASLGEQQPRSRRNNLKSSGRDLGFGSLESTKVLDVVVFISLIPISIPI